MPTTLDLARELYDAFAHADGQRLVALLHSDFHGHVSEGMPAGVGGTYVGATAMLREVWMPLAQRFAVRPVPERFLTCDGGDIVVLGHYEGQPPGSGRPLSAVFAHVLTFRDDRIAELLQITDTQRWVEAASDADIAVVETMFEAVRRRDASTLLNSYAANIEIREPAALPYGGVYHGHDGAIRHATAYTKCWHAIQTEDDRDLQPEILSARDHVIVLWRLKATTAERRLDVPVVDVIKLCGRQVVSLQMFHRDATAVREFLDSTAND
jgi:2-(1,2-epoxy-1,2-dihydrophenyl)acetyl-CoA isomerase